MISSQLLIGVCLILVTTLFHIFTLLMLARFLGRRYRANPENPSFGRLSMILFITTISLLVAHVIEATLWAFVYIALGEFQDISTALYFSIVTATTLGYGDITLSAQWHLLASLEAVGGLILFGASTAFMLEVMRKVFSSLAPESR